MSIAEISYRKLSISVSLITLAQTIYIRINYHDMNRYTRFCILINPYNTVRNNINWYAIFREVDRYTAHMATVTVVQKSKQYIRMSHNFDPNRIVTEKKHFKANKSTRYNSLNIGVGAWWVDTILGAFSNAIAIIPCRGIPYSLIEMTWQYRRHDYRKIM